MSLDKEKPFKRILLECKKCSSKTWNVDYDSNYDAHLSCSQCGQWSPISDPNKDSNYKINNLVVYYEPSGED